MRMILTALFLSVAVTGRAQSKLWRDVPIPGNVPVLKPVQLTDAQFTSFASMLRTRVTHGEWGCTGPVSRLRDDLKFESIPLSPRHDVVLIEAGECARGTQGANGAMWLVQLRPRDVVFLAGPDDRFAGWLYSIEAEASHGYHDLVVGWHMGGAEQDLSYFRFDGKRYRRISVATLTTDKDDELTIQPGRK